MSNRELIERLRSHSDFGFDGGENIDGWEISLVRRITKEAADALERLERENEELIERFVGLILHGDEEHRDWLIRAGKQFMENGTVPPPRTTRRITMTAPDRIWLQRDLADDDWQPTNAVHEVTWCWEPIYDGDVEYIRRDAFPVEELRSIAVDEFMYGDFAFSEAADRWRGIALQVLTLLEQEDAE